MKQLVENWRRYLSEADRGLAVVYFGGFKPPHKGHLEVVKEYLAMKDVEKIYIIFGRSVRKSDDGSVIVGDQLSKQAWELYLSSIGSPNNVEIITDFKGSPLAKAASMAFDEELKGMRITAGFTPKEPTYGKRFLDVVRSMERTKGPALAQPITLPAETNVPTISATKLRNALASGDANSVRKMIPDEVSVEEYISLFK